MSTPVVVKSTTAVSGDAGTSATSTQTSTAIDVQVAEAAPVLVSTSSSNTRGAVSSPSPFMPQGNSVRIDSGAGLVFTSGSMINISTSKE